ncbi:hypothetical protein [Bacillus thuringiensis]|uniref:hypothetical protein n=1 Tax=Bacillus thuringiensis TaxID=1428 RepID=UPI000B42FB41|nr:hypothetical protein [Bacillus thuringiensis]MED3182585.1 hypothetical protein [Bacillus thuringiensis]OTY08377.1 hypothetical protein BK734_17765 [Bacillus thuringiensis serovar kim]OUB17590.1 hypothetical protein BK733_17960 [Bacillus thuringiensis serovar xiaguangiensis]
MGKAIEVALHGIVVLDTRGDEDNDELEIRHTLITQAGFSPSNIQETRQMWHKGNNDGVSIVQDDNHVHLIRNFQTMVLNDFKVLVIGGHIAEEDTFNADNYMGHNFVTITQDEIDNFHPTGKYFPIFFLESPQQVRVNYTVKKLNL